MVEKKDKGQEEENNNYTKIKAARSDEQYLDLTSGKERGDLEPVQETCDICGLTARNKHELEQHINNAH